MSEGPKKLILRNFDIFEKTLKICWFEGKPLRPLHMDEGSLPLGRPKGAEIAKNKLKMVRKLLNFTLKGPIGVGWGPKIDFEKLLIVVHVRKS